jgi:diguanylate cyclase (GGDEF)-like protein
MASPVFPVSLFAKLKATKRLPSPPGTALRVLKLCRDENVDIQDIAGTIMSDPALSGRLLKFANSPMSGLGREVTSIRESIMLLGFRTVKLTALGFSVASPEAVSACRGFDLTRFWAESFLSAVIAKRVAAMFPSIEREVAFTAGLLARIGQVALAQGLREKYTPILQAAAEGRPLAEVEMEKLGVDHIQFGTQLLAEWDLPVILVEAVRRQQVPYQPTGATDSPPRLAQIIWIANRLVPAFIDHPGVRALSQDTPREIVEGVLKLDPAAWAELADGIQTDYLSVANVFNIQLDSHVSAMDLYAEAQEEATRVGMVAQLEQAKALEDNRDLLRRATTDPLTGVANRAKFDERIQEEIKGLRRGYGDFALIMFDIDHFKNFNDAHGHQAGDLVLRRVATAVQNALRELDLVARYGGEEFVVLVPHTDRKRACIITARIQRRVEELQIDVNGTRLGVTISSGLAITADYATVPTAEKLLADADAQSYLSKKAGRNTWSYLGRSASQLAHTCGTGVSPV